MAAEVDQSEKDLALTAVKFFAEDYDNALTAVEFERQRLADACKRAHAAGAKDREIAEAASMAMTKGLTRGRIQQLRTLAPEARE